MALRWYTIVVDCRDPKAQAQWWGEVLGWHKIYEAEDEVVLVPEWVTLESVKATPWDRQSQGLVFGTAPEGKTVKNRLHIDLAPHTSDDRDAEIARSALDGCDPGRRRPDRRGELGRLRGSGGQRVLRALVAGPVARGQITPLSRFSQVRRVSSTSMGPVRISIVPLTRLGAAPESTYPFRR